MIKTKRIIIMYTFWIQGIEEFDNVEYLSVIFNSPALKNLINGCVNVSDSCFFSIKQFLKYDCD